MADQLLVLEVDHQQVAAGQCDLQPPSVGRLQQLLLPHWLGAQEAVLLVLLEQTEGGNTHLAQA